MRSDTAGSDNSPEGFGLGGRSTTVSPIGPASARRWKGETDLAASRGGSRREDAPDPDPRCGVRRRENPDRERESMRYWHAGWPQTQRSPWRRCAAASQASEQSGDPSRARHRHDPWQQRSAPVISSLPCHRKARIGPGVRTPSSVLRVPRSSCKSQNRRTCVQDRVRLLESGAIRSAAR